MKKYTALVLALIMVLTVALAGCGKDKPEDNSGEPAPENITTDTTVPDDGAEPEAQQAPVTWKDLVGEWYLKTLYYDYEMSTDGTDPGFWDAAQQNVDSRITVYESEGIDYLWASKYGVDDDFEDMPFEIVNEPVDEDETYMDWCIVAQPYDYLTMRIALTDADTLVCIEHYFDDDIELSSTHKGIYTKEGPIEFHKSDYHYEDLVGTWYQYDYEIDGDSGLCYESGTDTWICFNEDMTADFYSGNINYPEDAEFYEGCAVTIAEEPILSWLDDDYYPDRQDWSVYVDIPCNEYSEEEVYQFGFIDDYTVTMYHEIVADGGSYHVGSVGNFGYYSPFEGEGYYVSQLPQVIQDLVDVAADDQWVVVLSNPSDEIKTVLDYEEWPINDCTGYYDWDNAGELVIAPVDMPMQLQVYTGKAVYDADGNFSYWEKEDFMYDDFLEPGQLWRGIVDLPEDPADATLCLFMGFGDMGLDGGDEFFIRLCDFDAEDPYLYFQ